MINLFNKLNTVTLKTTIKATFIETLSTTIKATFPVALNATIKTAFNETLSTTIKATFPAFLLSFIKIIFFIFLMNIYFDAVYFDSTIIYSFILIIVYNNVGMDKSRILSDNKGKIGIYMWTHIETGRIYIGSAFDLSDRLSRYFSH
jgi:hypothetical protein